MLISEISRTPVDSHTTAPISKCACLPCSMLGSGLPFGRDQGSQAGILGCRILRTGDLELRGGDLKDRIQAGRGP